MHNGSLLSIIMLLSSSLVVLGQKVPFCQYVESFKNLETIYCYYIDDSGILYDDSSRIVTDLYSSIESQMHSNFKAKHTLIQDSWTVELTIDSSTQMEVVYPWLTMIDDIGIPTTLLRADSDFYDKIDGFWTAGIGHRNIIDDSPRKIIRSFIDSINAPPPPDGFPGEKYDWYVSENIFVESMPQSLELTIDRQWKTKIASSLSTKISECYGDSTCQFIITLEDNLDYGSFVSFYSEIKSMVLSIRNEVCRKQFDKEYQDLSKRDQMDIEMRYPMIVKLQQK